MVKLTHFDMNQFTPFSVGFDRVFDRLYDNVAIVEQPTKLVDSHHTISERQMTLNMLLKLPCRFQHRNRSCLDRWCFRD